MDGPLAMAITACSAYLVGSIPTAAWVATANGLDIYSVGSGNPGASNVSRVLGKKWAVAVFVVDAAKGAAPVAVSRFGLGQGWAVASLMGLVAVVGHSWPVLAKFRGGKGVATGGGALLVLHPLVALGAALLWGALAKVTKKASLASLVAMVAALLGVVIFGRTWQEKAVIASMAGVVAVRHLPNIKRLLAGDELSLQAVAESETTPATPKEDGT